MKKQSQNFDNWKKISFGLIILHLLLLGLTSFIAWPEMLFWPYLLLKGWLPYRDIAIVHTPLLIVFLTLIYKAIGIGFWQQKLATWIIILLTDTVFLLSIRRLFGVKKSVFALFIYILLQLYYQGNGIWFDHAMTLFSILVFYFLSVKQEFRAGLAWGLALLTKQTAIWLLPPILLFKISRKFIQGLIIVLIIFIVILFIFGIWRSFFDWAIIFGLTKLPHLSGQIRLPSMKESFAGFLPFLVIIPALFLKDRKLVFPIICWSIFGLMGVYPRYELFHFQPALPYLALLYLFVLTGSSDKLFWFSIIISFLSGIIIIRGLTRMAHQPSRFMELNDIDIENYVKKITSENEKIFVTNYWDNLYPLTGTLPITRPFIPQIPWYIQQDNIESEIANQLNNLHPALIIRGSPAANGFDLINQTIDNNYQVVKRINNIDIYKLK